MRLMTAISASALIMTAAPAMALTMEMAHPVTVDQYTPAQKDKALGAARAQGYSDLSVAMYQAGSFFVKGDKGGNRYLMTVTPDGKVYPSTPMKPG